MFAKGLNLSIPPKALNYADLLLPFEQTFYHLHRDNTELNPEQLDHISSTMKSSACECLNLHDPKREQNLSDEEANALKELLKDEGIIIQKAIRATQLSS